MISILSKQIEKSLKRYAQKKIGDNIWGDASKSKIKELCNGVWADVAHINRDNIVTVEVQSLDSFW